MPCCTNVWTTKLTNIWLYRGWGWPCKLWCAVREGGHSKHDRDRGGLHFIVELDGDSVESHAKVILHNDLFVAQGKVAVHLPITAGNDFDIQLLGNPSR